MKKLLFTALACATVCVCAAQEEVDVLNDEPQDIDMFADDDQPQVVTVRPRKQMAQWPVFLAVSEFPETPDIVGFRLTIPFSTKQESVTGFDVGLWGRAGYFEGLMLNVLRNNVKDNFTGLQVGLYNSNGYASLFAAQVGLWNESLSLCGVQVGLSNLVGEGEGFQIGLINRAETFHGFQVGLINVIRDNEVTFFPIVNAGF